VDKKKYRDINSHLKRYITHWDTHPTSAGEEDIFSNNIQPNDDNAQVLNISLNKTLDVQLDSIC